VVEVRREPTTQTTQPATRFLTTGKVATRIGVSRETVRRWCQSGTLKATRAAGLQNSPWRIQENDLSAFIAGQDRPND